MGESTPVSGVHPPCVTPPTSMHKDGGIPLQEVKPPIESTAGLARTAGDPSGAARGSPDAFENSEFASPLLFGDGVFGDQNSFDTPPRGSQLGGTFHGGVPHHTGAPVAPVRAHC